ncbi:MAG: c-type cytochrome domain-containing protein [Pirellulales bacterium]
MTTGISTMLRTFVALLCIASAFNLPTVRADEEVTYAKDIAPLWQRSCSACHNAKKAEGGLNLETAALLLKGSDSGATVVPGKSAESEIIKRVIATDDSFMPPKNNSAGAKPLSEKEIELVKRWIDGGAKPGEAVGPQAITWKPMPGNVKAVYAIDVSSDGQFVAAGRANQVVVYQWPIQLEKPGAVALVDPAVGSSGVGGQAAHLDVVQSTAFSPDSERLASGGYRALKIWKRELAPVDDGLIPADSVAAQVDVSGTKLAVLKGDKSIAITEAATGKLLHTIAPQSNNPSAVAWAADGRSLFVADDAPKVTLFKFVDGAEPVAESVAAPQPIKEIAALSADKALLIGADGNLLVYSRPAPAAGADAAAPPPAPMMAPPAEAVGGVVSISVLATTPAKFVVTSRDGQIRVSDVESVKTERSWKAPTEVVRSVIDRSGAWVVTQGIDNNLRVWQAADGKEVKVLNREGSTTRVVSIAKRDAARQESLIEKLNAGLKELETANQKEQEVLKKLAEAREKAAADLAAKMAEIEKNTAAIKAAEAGITASQQAIAAEMKKIEQYTAEMDAKKKEEEKLVKNKDASAAELAKQEQAMAAGKDSADRASAEVPAHQAKIEAAKTKLTSVKVAVEEAEKADQADRAQELASMAFTFDASKLVLARKTGVVDVIDITSGRKAAELKAGLDQLQTLVVTPEKVLAAKPGAPAKSWSGKFDWRLERTIGSETDPNSILSDRVTAVCFSPDGKQIAVGSGPASRFGDLKVFNVADGALVKDYGEVHSDTILDIAYSPDGLQIATAGADKIIRIIDVGADKPKLSLEGHTHHVLAVAWQDNARVLASAGADGALKVWDVTTGEQQRTVQGFSKEITSLAFVGQTSQVIASCADNSLRLVECNNGQTVRNFGGSASSLYAVGVTSDGKQVVAGGQDGNVILWQVDNANLIRKLQ